MMSCRLLLAIFISVIMSKRSAGEVMEQFFTNIWNSIVEYFANLGNNADEILLDLIQIIAVVVGAKLLMYLFNRFLKRTLKRTKDKKPESQLAKKSDTIESVSRSVSRLVIYFVALMAILGILGLGTTVSSLLATAGIGGVAIAFGAQSLVKDIVSGIFFLFEDQFSVGEYVEIEGEKGTVEEITIRTTKINKFSGETTIIPNGSIGKVTNYSRGDHLAIISMSVAYDSDINKVSEIMQAVGEEYKEAHDNVIEEPHVLGVCEMNDSDMVVKMIMRVQPLTHWVTEREVRQKIKDEFDKNGIEIPFPHRVVISK